MVALAAELPDIDFLLPVRHRGPTHSLLFAGGVGASFGLVRAPRGGRRALALGAVAGMAAATHAALDLLTGESGARIRWPVGSGRFTLPAAPLPASPIGPAMATPSGALRFAGELAWAVPLAAVGLWPWRHRLRGLLDTGGRLRT